MCGENEPENSGRIDRRRKIGRSGIREAVFGRSEWVTKMMEDREEEIRPCILCHNGCFNMCHYKGVPNDQELSDSLHLSRCAVNAETMQWDRHFIEKTKNPRRVYIIGGGIGGMEAARVLKLREHDPVIYEKNNVLGGTFIPASAESYKGKLRELLAWYRRQMKELDVEVHLGKEIDSVEKFGDAPVIIATGSVPRVMKNIPGHERMIEACDYLNGRDVGERVVVIGGGLTGSEIAYELALQERDRLLLR